MGLWEILYHIPKILFGVPKTSILREYFVKYKWDVNLVGFLWTAEKNLCSLPNLKKTGLKF